MVKKISFSIILLVMLMILSSCVDKYPDKFKYQVESMIVDIQDNVSEEAFCSRWSEHYNETDEDDGEYISCRDHYNYLNNLNIPKSTDDKYYIYYTEKEEDVKNNIIPYYYKHNDVEYLIGMIKNSDFFLKIR